MVSLILLVSVRRSSTAVSWLCYGRKSRVDIAWYVAFVEGSGCQVYCNTIFNYHTKLFLNIVFMMSKTEEPCTQLLCGSKIC